MSADAYLISGIPGAGKTTVARALALRFGRGVHIEGDFIGHHFIVRGLVSPEAEPQDEARRQIDLRRKHIRMLTDSFTHAGFVTVVDDVIVSRGVLESYRALDSRIRFVQLTPRLDVVEARDAGRDKHVFQIWKHLNDQLHSWPEPRPGLWLDTSDMDVDQTVHAILDCAQEALIS